MATWPSTLPTAPLVNGYSVDPASNVIRSDMEIGPARVRRIATSRNDQVSISLVLVGSQVTAFRDWFDDSSSGLAGGVNWFTGLRLNLDGTVTTPECRFVGKHSFSLVDSKRYRLTAKVEVR